MTMPVMSDGLHKLESPYETVGYFVTGSKRLKKP